MQPVRPESVPADATLIYPGQSFGPGVGVQSATLRAITAQIDRINANAELVYERALEDWNTNKQIDQAYNLPVPPQPAAPRLIKVTIVYADIEGNIITDSGEILSGLLYAWCEERYS